MLVGIFGTGRNGSTLITRLLDGIPDTYVHPVEVIFLTALDDLASKGRISKKTKHYARTGPLKYLDRDIENKLLINNYSYHVKEILSDYVAKLEEDININLDVNPLQALTAKSEYNVRDFIMLFLKVMSDWINNNRLVTTYMFKTIEVPYIRYYEEIFPDMKFIHIIRNPIDVFASLIRATRQKTCPARKPLWHLGGDSLNTMINKRWIIHARNILDRKDLKNHYVVRFEDLTRTPLDTIKSICSWLGLPMPESPTKQTVLGGKIIKKLPVNVGQVGVETPVEVVSNMKNIFNYDEFLSPCERDLIVYLTYNYAKEFGYVENIPLPEKRKILKEWIIPKKWEFLHSKNIFGVCISLFKVFQRRFIYFSKLSMRL